MPFKIRPATRANIPEVHKLECASFPNPWKLDFFYEELKNNNSYLYVGQEESTEILAYSLFRIIDNFMDLYKIVVSSKVRRTGLGSQLLIFILSTARQKNVKEIFIEVRESNKPAITFYEKYNFKKISDRKNYYNAPKENALIYKYET